MMELEQVNKMSKCVKDKYSSRVCEKGTKCCNVRHKMSDKHEALSFKEWLKKEDANIDIYNYPEEAMEMAWNAACSLCQSAVLDELNKKIDDIPAFMQYAGCRPLLYKDEVKVVIESLRKPEGK